MSAAQPHQQGRRHSLNAHFSFVEPANTAHNNKQGNGENDESSKRTTEQHHKQSVQNTKAAEKGKQQQPSTKVITPTSKQVPASTPAKNNITQGENVPLKKGQSVQTGIDRYVNIKRKLSPSKAAVNPKKFQVGTPNMNKTGALNGNRFALLSKSSDDVAKEFKMDVDMPTTPTVRSATNGPLIGSPPPPRSTNATVSTAASGSGSRAAPSTPSAQVEPRRIRCPLCRRKHRPTLWAL
ncbi:uncharacterized protein LOC120768705 [Bactrocera tryoni]|uniref:uncharacterized protein LOC120768705 n=1 Tax=Bactrocera tryoni TaxID=59916 RepID=UPI001A97AFF5|nr:uncharacterized protein LOC120768705 [Bactrocera tryoni]